ncbi:hypothetical protein BMW23_0953 [Bodo saltans virus]|uniref:Uncharacterized protein n=1 Tax=Bodo saltans virus TaxID=2024608 RepID=A0A2H4UVP5_9VIRU|nr:hypothetical protein QJ851_gp0935 [Bodo saltans virus]ATZ80998.1 hypothetical protein BMW23_0953 [Bodo saltans virus]
MELKIFGNGIDYFHKPADFDKTQKIRIVDGRIVCGNGSTWAYFNEHRITKLYHRAPFVENHFSVSVSIWNPEKLSMTYVIAEKTAYDDVASFSNLSTDIWKIHKAFVIEYEFDDESDIFRKKKQYYIDGIDILDTIIKPVLITQPLDAAYCYDSQK